MACCQPKIVKDYDLENDPVMKDLRENFREEETYQEKKQSKLGKMFWLGTILFVISLLVLWLLA